MLNADQLRNMLGYDPGTGVLTWKARLPEWFPTSKRWSRENRCRAWNAKYAGKQALNTINAAGYYTGGIMQKTYYAHRVIWCICFGYWPEEIDHDNGVRSDNRLWNLTECSHAKNMKNIKKRNDNSSGVTGVSWDSSRSKWASEININGKKIHLGRFDNLLDAEKARMPHEINNGFTATHGRR